MATELTLLSDPEIAAVRVVDSGEALRDVAEAPESGLRLDRREAAPNALLHHVRSGLFDRLVQAQRDLPAGLHLLLVEGYRPPDLQRSQFEAYSARLAAANPRWGTAVVRREASRFISPPEVAPHCTGGAIDLTLCTDDGDELDLGTAVNASPLDSADRCYTAAPDITPTASANRVMLASALTSAGLVNYPTEWWHWSYGDRYWAYTVSRDSHYGPCSPGTGPATEERSGYSRTGPDPSRLSGSK
jgi:D-alanyl-D-alanine dipeptidase